MTKQEHIEWLESEINNLRQEIVWREEQLEAVKNDEDDALDITE